MRLFTLTANLLAETTYAFDAWSEGATQRAQRETFQVGGKGVNVARMLQRLGVEATALCFPGGATGARCIAWLRENGVEYGAFPTSTETRTGAVVRAPDRAETTFLGAENVVDATAIAACADFLDTQPDGELLALCGSAPEWTNARWNPLRAALARWAARSVLLIDTYGPPLAGLVDLPAALVKINRRELAGLVGRKLDELTDEAMPDILADLARTRRARRWVVTDGPRAVWFVEDEGSPRTARPPAIRERSPTGSGDVLLAGLIRAHFVRGSELVDALESAISLASANAAAADFAAFEL